MFGKLVEYSMQDNKLHLSFEKNRGIIEIINPYVINIFSPLKYDNHFSKAITDLKIQKCNILVNKKDDFLEISTEKLLVKVYDDFKVDFYK